MSINQPSDDQTQLSLQRLNSQKKTVVIICGILAVLLAIRYITSLDWGKAFPPSGRDHKAVASLSKAARIAGGFSGTDRRLYRVGILHIQHQRERVGSFTIDQVISDEKSREDAVHQRREQVATNARAANIESGEKDDMKATLGLIQQSEEGAAMLKGYAVDGDHLTLQLDDDVYGAMSNQDKTMFKETMWKAWAVSYNQRHGTSGEHVFLEIQDLNGGLIDSYY